MFYSTLDMGSLLDNIPKLREQEQQYPYELRDILEKLLTKEVRGEFKGIADPKIVKDSDPRITEKVFLDHLRMNYRFDISYTLAVTESVDTSFSYEVKCDSAEHLTGLWKDQIEFPPNVASAEWDRYECSPLVERTYSPIKRIPTVTVKNIELIPESKIEPRQFGGSNYRTQGFRKEHFRKETLKNYLRGEHPEMEEVSFNEMVSVIERIYSK
tara:strand:+ start:1128 stop:1766 length:639 start_codon:yes stop_codon:yes gene_type:complete